jgi:aspartate/methionine/tyrosine aminotransferase
MVPGPVQAGAVVALDDDAHVEVQRTRYRDRLSFLADALALAGLPVAFPAGGFYLWLPVPDRFDDGWDLCDWLAREAGLLVSPGELYGPAGSGHVRVAVVQPHDRLELVAERLGSIG